MKILITGSAGFIGFHTVKKYAESGYDIVGLDNINNYYATSLKYDRLNESGIDSGKILYNEVVASTVWNNYRFVQLNLEDTENVNALFKAEQFDLVIHLAAQAGVRYSLENPNSYIQSNIVGFTNILESCRHNKIATLIYASSSSVYGLSEKPLLSTDDIVDKPVSLYAATKKSNELMAHVYSHLYGITTIGLRLFTVYGPWGRPDMAPFIFADAISNNKPMRVFNHGNMQRDFTYVDDIVDGIYSVSKNAWSNKYNILNIGNNSPIKLIDFIGCLETELGKFSIKEFCEMQPGDVIATWADTTELVKATGYTPKTDIREGVKKFVKWYTAYYKKNK